MGNCNCLRRWRNVFRHRDEADIDIGVDIAHQGGFIASYLDEDPILHPAPGISRPMSQLTEEEQVKIATRMALISTLHSFKCDEDAREKLVECIICMCDYEEGDELRYLPCLHTYHRTCIDDWLMRSLTCPSCLAELHPTSPVSYSSRSSTARSRMGIAVASPPMCTPQPPPVTVTMTHYTDSFSITLPYSQDSGDLDRSCDSQKCGDSRVVQELVSQTSDEVAQHELNEQSGQDKEKLSPDRPVDNLNDNNRSAGDVITHAPPPPFWRAQSLPQPFRRTRSSNGNDSDLRGMRISVTDRMMPSHIVSQPLYSNLRRGISMSERLDTNISSSQLVHANRGSVGENHSGTIERRRMELNRMRQDGGDSHGTRRN